MLVAKTSLRQQQERQMFALRSTGQLTVPLSHCPTVPAVRVNLVYKASTFRIQKLNGATWARGERDTGHADSATIGKGEGRGGNRGGGLSSWPAARDPFGYLPDQPHFKTFLQSMHKHNNNNNKGGLDSVTLCRGNRRGAGGRAGRGWGIWKKCCYNNQNALNCKTYNFTVIFSLVSCNFFSTHA